VTINHRMRSLNRLWMGAFLAVLVCVAGERALAQADLLASPHQVNATRNDFVDKIVVSWSAVEGAATYDVFRSTLEKYMYIPWTTTSETSISDRNFGASQHYYYKVRACRDGSCGPFTDPVIGSWDIAVPSGVSATRGRFSDKIVITWERVTGATLYYVCRAAEEDGTYRVLAMVYRTEFVDTGGSAGTTHFYRIRALTTSTGSGLSEAALGYRDATPSIPSRYRTLTEGDSVFGN
jgi:fibronectin type 3 domain-containing protein